MRRLFAVAVLVMAASGSPAGEPAAPEWKFSGFQNKGDSARAEVADGKTVIRVKCPRGIGHFTTATAKGTWPEHVVLFLEGINELEHFEFSTGRMRVQGSRKASGGFALYVVGDDGDFNKRSFVGTLAVKVDRRKDGVEVTFPGKLFADADSVSFAWIDWLRR